MSCVDVNSIGKNFSNNANENTSVALNQVYRLHGYVECCMPVTSMSITPTLIQYLI
jgi:hypothetical protein